jgi:hypothetical protein
MKKIAYNNAGPVKMPKTTQEIPSVTVSDNDSGARGYAALGEQASPVEYDDDIFMKKKRVKVPVDYSRLKKLLVGLADGLDHSGDHKSASFADFLIKKVAKQNALDYEFLLKELVVKVSESDLTNKNQFIISLIKAYNLELLNRVKSGASTQDSHMEAYQAASERVQNYVV